MKIIWPAFGDTSSEPLQSTADPYSDFSQIIITPKIIADQIMGSDPQRVLF
jgi:hypothetical protein